VSSPEKTQSSKPEALEGVLERIVYTNEESAWSVVRLSVAGRREPVTAVGNLLAVRPGESLRLEGRWIRDRKYGEQFQADSYRTMQPATVRGIERYLGSGLIPGIGPVMAKRLVERFGEATLEVIENHPERLRRVEGIGPKRCRQIQRAWVDQREIKEVMLFLQAHGISTHLAIRIYKHYGAEAIELMKQNPYRLATDLYGVGFKTADEVAQNLGLPTNSPERVRAGVLHLLGEAAGDGHLFLPRSRLVEQAASVLEVEPSLVEQGVAGLKESAEVEAETLEEGPDEAVYLKALHTSETGVAGRLRALLAAPLLPLKIDVEKAIAWFEGGRGLTLADAQRDAARQALSRKVLVITGGPGTGKTTLVQAIVRILDKKQRRVLLAAPTGRAAKRLAEATGSEAKTIHRLLEFNPRRRTFERGPQRPLRADFVVVDEVSMLDTVLAYHLLSALRDRCQLLLVGDVDQLPSVGPGKVLADLIDSGAVAVVRLDEVFRQAARSLIVVNAHRINRGQMPVWESAERSGDFFFIERQEPEEILETLKYLVTDRIPTSLGFDPRQEIQVLTPMNRGLLGTIQLNAELRTLLNPSGPVIQRGGQTFRVGDRVMQVRNNYELEVFNGDIGSIRGIDEEAQEVRIGFDDRNVAYSYSDLDELVLAYACSIHKAQGSEYPCVVVPLHGQHFVMLQRNLLYTALTRARRLAVLVGQRQALATAVSRKHTSRRYTLLARRLGVRQ
jgi:exodeoxyribonuclease V alpha subunit